MPLNHQSPYQSIPVPERTTKPRSAGLTMMIDWGMGVARQRDTLESGGSYIDFAKIAAGIARVLPGEVLKQKLDLYHEAGISTSPGGLFTELAFAQGGYDAFLEETQSLGFSGIEISDNLLDFPPKQKAECIRKAKHAGLKVFGEVGKKEGMLDDDTVIADVDDCLNAGADWVYLEAHELFSVGKVRAALIERVRHEFPAEKIIYELPVVILPDITRDYKHKITAKLVSELGTEVNLANVEWDEVYITEIVRRGLAGDTSHPQGALRLAGIGCE